MPRMGSEHMLQYLGLLTELASSAKHASSAAFLGTDQSSQIFWPFYTLSHSNAAAQACSGQGWHDLLPQ